MWAGFIKILKTIGYWIVVIIEWIVICVQNILNFFDRPLKKINQDYSQAGLLITQVAILLVSIYAYFDTISPVYERDLIKKEYLEIYNDAKVLISETVKTRMKECVKTFTNSNQFFSSEINDLKVNKQLDSGVKRVKFCLEKQEEMDLYELLNYKDKQKLVSNIKKFNKKFIHKLRIRVREMVSGKKLISKSFPKSMHQSKMGDISSNTTVYINHDYEELIFE